MPRAVLTNTYTALQMQVINRLAEIEKADADACANCGGEDCICCEIYHDRQKWVSPEELFKDDDPYGDYGRGHDDLCECGCYSDEWCDSCGKCADCCTCEEDN